MTESVEIDWSVTLAGLALAYGFLGRAFYREPDGALIRQLCDEDLFADWPQESPEPETRTGLDMLRTFCAGWQDQDLADLRWDYTRLFVGPAKLLAPPWESVYTDRDRALFDETTLDVRQLYARFGLQSEKLYQEPDDHLGLELAFLSHLCERGLAAVEAGDSPALQEALAAQAAFLGDHLLRWAPLCLARVVEHALTGYYRGLAYLALGTMTGHARLLSVQPSSLKDQP